MKRILNSRDKRDEKKQFKKWFGPSGLENNMASHVLSSDMPPMGSESGREAESLSPTLISPQAMRQMTGITAFHPGPNVDEEEEEEEEEVEEEEKESAVDAATAYYHYKLIHDQVEHAVGHPVDIVGIHGILLLL
ncbi:hypothetical protein SprV_0301297600 [Sparganum proliferum]